VKLTFFGISFLIKLPILTSTGMFHSQLAEFCTPRFWSPRKQSRICWQFL